MTLKRKCLWIGGGLLLGIAALGASFTLVLRHPEPLFAWSAGDDDLRLYSDEPFAEADALAVIEKAKERLRTSPDYQPGRRDVAFLCNARWRRMIFFAVNRRAAGLNYAPVTRNVFLSGGRVAENRLVSPSGKVVEDERTLAYFIAHEIAHSLCVERCGFWKYHRISSWLKEAYVDYFARGSVFERSGAREAFVADAPEMNFPKVAPYLRYNLLFGFLVEHEGRQPMEAFASGVEQAEVERRLREFLTGEAGGGGR